MVSEIVLSPVLDSPPRISVADKVFDRLKEQIVTLDLPPGTKMSEADVARQLGVSRQPVRDAFYRLSKLGFLNIRPQRATTVTRISANAVLRARFIRLALEVETIRVAVSALSDGDHDVLQTLLQRQDAAIIAADKAQFHALDDEFHREIAARSGLEFAWDLIRENKAHMDRVRYLSLSFASRTAYEEHISILKALRAHDADMAAEAMRDHLSRIVDLIEQIRASNHSWFEGDDADA